MNDQITQCPSWCTVPHASGYYDAELDDGTLTCCHGSNVGTTQAGAGGEANAWVSCTEYRTADGSIVEPAGIVVDVMLETLNAAEARAFACDLIAAADLLEGLAS